MTLKMTTAQVVETSVTVTNSSFQNYTHPDDHTTRTKNGCIRENFRLYSGKSGSHRQSGCTRAKLLYFGKSCCVRGKVVIFRQKWLYSGKVVVLGQKLLYSGQNGCIRAKVVVFVQRGFTPAKMVVLGQKWL